MTIDARNRISRRTLAAGAAWAVPVVTLTAAAPAQAASGPGPQIDVSSACKSPGNSCHLNPPQGYGLLADICNNGAETIYIYKISYTNVTDLIGNPLPYTFTSNQTFTLLAGACQDVLIFASSANSANIDFKMDMVVKWGHTATDGADPLTHPNMVIPIKVPETSPDCCK